MRWHACGRPHSCSARLWHLPTFRQSQSNITVHCNICVHIKAHQSHWAHSIFHFLLSGGEHSHTRGQTWPNWIHTYIQTCVCMYVLYSTPLTEHTALLHTPPSLTLIAHPIPTQLTPPYYKHMYVYTYTQHWQHFLHLFLTRIVYAYVPAPPTPYMYTHFLLYSKHKRLNRLQPLIERQARVMCAHGFVPPIPYQPAHPLPARPLLTSPAHSLPSERGTRLLRWSMLVTTVRLWCSMWRPAIRSLHWTNSPR